MERPPVGTQSLTARPTKATPTLENERGKDLLSAFLTAVSRLSSAPEDGERQTGSESKTLILDLVASLVKTKSWVSFGQNHESRRSDGLRPHGGGQGQGRERPSCLFFTQRVAQEPPQLLPALGEQAVDP